MPSELTTLFARLFGKDPTSEWPPADGKTPSFDPERGTLGGARFGDPFEKLRVLGRPDEFEGDAAASCNLFYDAAGYRVECEGGNFIGVTFHFGPNFHRKKIVPTTASVAGMRLTGATQPDDVRAWLGEPDKEDKDEEFVELDYVRGKNHLLFEFDAQAGLRILDIFLDDG